MCVVFFFVSLYGTCFCFVGGVISFLFGGVSLFFDVFVCSPFSLFGFVLCFLCLLVQNMFCFSGGVISVFVMDILDVFMDILDV